jgi:hypothetical protein
MPGTIQTLEAIGALHFPLSRSRMLVFLVAVNLIALGADTLLAHWIDRTIKVYEWIPIIHGPITGLFVLWFVFRPRPTRAEIVLYLLVILSAVAVGVLGTAFHWQRALLARGAASPGFLQWLIFAPPATAPLSFAGVGLLGLMATLHEEPRDSGRLTLWGLVHLRAPISKTRLLLWIVGLGYAGATASAVLDHARRSFENPSVWIAVAAGIFATVVTLGMANAREPSHGDHVVHFWTQVVLAAVGILGLGMHLSADLSGTGELNLERLINHAPPFAPLLFTNLAFIGIISVLRPARGARSA